MTEVSDSSRRGKRPILVLLHGTRSHHPDSWLAPINAGLAYIGGSEISRADTDLIWPRYIDSLYSRPDGLQPANPNWPSEPRQTSKELYDARKGELWRRLGDWTSPNWPSLDHRVTRTVAGKAGRVTRKMATVTGLRSGPRLERADIYRKRRPLAMARLLEQLPSSGDFVVVAHSLGSVVACDLLRYLGPEQRISSLVTIGSPLGIQGMWKQSVFPIREHFPYDRLGAWVNISSAYDPVTGWRGLHHRHLPVIDLHIAPRWGRSDPHSPGSYVRHRAFATTLAWALADAREHDG